MYIRACGYDILKLRFSLCEIGEMADTRGHPSGGSIPQAGRHIGEIAVIMQVQILPLTLIFMQLLFWRFQND